MVEPSSGVVPDYRLALDACTADSRSVVVAWYGLPDSILPPSISSGEASMTMGAPPGFHAGTVVDTVPVSVPVCPPTTVLPIRTEPQVLWSSTGPIPSAWAPFLHCGGCRF